MDRQVRGNELRHREHRCVERIQIGSEELPDVWVRLRRVDVTAPDPAPTPHTAELEEGRRLRVVQEDEVVVLLEEFCVVGIVLPVEGLVVGVEAARVPLEGIVDRFGDAEELFIARDRSPVRDQAEIAQQGHHGPEKLGNAPAVWGGVHVQDPSAAERLCLADEFVQDGVGSDSSVGLDEARSDVDVLEHLRPSLLRYFLVFLGHERVPIGGLVAGEGEILAVLPQLPPVCHLSPVSGVLAVTDLGGDRTGPRESRGDERGRALMLPATLLLRKQASRAGTVKEAE